MGMSLGEVITRGGTVSRRSYENELTGQSLANNQLNMADRFRGVQREMETRRGRAARFPQNGNPIQPLNLPPVGIASVPGAAPAAPTPMAQAPGQMPTPQQQAPQRPAQNPAAMQEAYTGGVDTSGIPSNLTPGENNNAILAQQNARLQQIQNPISQHQETDANMAGGANTRGFGTQPAPVVQNTGVAQGAPSATPAVSTAPANAPQAIPPAPSGPQQVWSAETSPERYQVAQLDAQIKQMEADYQRVLPHAQDAEAAQYLTGVRQQLMKLSIGRNQLMLNDSFNEMAATGNPSRVTQVMNAMGYKIKFKSGSNGRIQIIGADGKKTSEGLPHQLAGQLRMSFNAEFQKMRMEAQYAERQLHITGKYKIAGDKLGADSKVKAATHRNVEYGKIQANKPQLSQAADGSTIIVHNNQVYRTHGGKEEYGPGGKFISDPGLTPLNASNQNLGLPPAPGSKEFSELFNEDGSDTWP